MLPKALVACLFLYSSLGTSAQDKKNDVVAPTATCPNGYTFDGQQCVRTLTVPATVKCPEGFEISPVSGHFIKQCIRSDTKLPRAGCEAGYTLERNQCVKEETIAPSITCPKGFTQTKDECLRSEACSGNLVCPKNYILDHGVCIRTTSVPPILECPEEYSYSQDECVMTEKVKATMTCPKDFTHNGRTCERLHREPPKPICPGGGTLRPVNATSTHRSLQADFLQAWTCPKNLTWSASKSCEPGTSLDEKTNQCVGTEQRDQWKGCHDELGFFLNNHTGLCEKMETTPIVQVCAPGSVNRFPPCFSAPLVAGLHNCPRGCEMRDAECICDVKVAPTTNCPKGYTLVNSNCEQVDTVDLTYTCPPGSELQGSDCAALEYAQPTYICPDGYDNEGGRCVQESVEPPKCLCPDGSQPAKGSRKCNKGDSQPPLPVCSGGYRLVSGKCMRTIAAPPVTSCDTEAGYHFNAVKQVCELNKEIEAQLVCPKGYDPSPHTESCIRTQFSQPSYVTPAVGKKRRVL